MPKTVPFIPKTPPFLAVLPQASNANAGIALGGMHDRALVMVGGEKTLAPP